MGVLRSFGTLSHTRFNWITHNKKNKKKIGIHISTLIAHK